MSKKSPKRSSPRRKKSSPPLLSEDTQRDIVALILLGLAIVTVVTLLFPQGDLGLWWRDLVTRAFGWGWPLIVAGVGTLAIYWLRQRFDEQFTFPVISAVGAIIILLATLGMLHIVATISGEVQALPASESGGGGTVGYWIGSVASRIIGRAAAFGLLLVVAGIGAILALNISLKDIVEAAKDTQALLSDLFHRSLTSRPGENGGLDGGHEDSPALSRPEYRPANPQPIQSGPPILRLQPGNQAVQPPLLPPQVQPSIQAPPPTTIRREWQLPTPDFLEASIEQELSQTDIRRRVKIIEETLANFHIQARVVEVNQGPAVTQFGVQPAAGVTVNRIVARQNDLSLALAAAPIRIEAPVPGRSVVGIEVPNATISVVGMRGVVESSAFQKMHAKTKLALALGQDVSGQPKAADLGKMPHLLIAGATGSGKSVCINAIVACYLMHCTPDDLKFIMVDPKMVELVAYNGIPHLLVPVVTEIDKVVNVLKWTASEMERRYRLFSSHGARNIEAYNAAVTPKSGREFLPYIVVIIDELADIMMLSPDEVERLLCRLAQMARATGIHLIIATQRPSVDVITGLIKANFPARISFAVTSQVDSRVVLDMPGAEKLLGRGDMLYMPSDSSSPIRLQGVWMSDREMEWLINFWRGEAPRLENMPLPDITQNVSIADGDGSSSDADPMLGEAKRVVRQAQHASASLLQRKLRVGYARAARLIDLLEEEGLVGPAQDGGRTRDVFPPTADSPESPPRR